MFRKLAPALVASLLLLGACAKEADGTQVLTGDAAVVALRAAPDAAAEAGSAHFEMTMSIQTPEGAFDVVATGGYSGTRATMEMDLGAAFADMAEASGESVPAGFDEPLTMVFDGTAMYMRFPMLDALTGTSKWLSMDLEELGAAGDQLGFGAGSGNPAQLLEALRGVADDIEELGQQDIRGVPTSGYKVTVDLARALEQATEGARELLEPALEQLGDAQMPVEVWIDADGLPRRVVTDMSDLMAAAGAGLGAASATMEFFDYGTPVEVQVPDPSETVSFMDVMGDLGASNMDAVRELG